MVRDGPSKQRGKTKLIADESSLFLYPYILHSVVRFSRIRRPLGQFSFGPGNILYKERKA
jgi:hypothetical protein